jgi:hypothetical protein
LFRAPCDRARPVPYLDQGSSHGRGLKVELVDAPGLWGERRYTIRSNGKPATKVKVATLSEVFHRLRRWTVARAERA